MAEAVGMDLRDPTLATEPSQELLEAVGPESDAGLQDMEMRGGEEEGTWVARSPYLGGQDAPRSAARPDTLHRAGRLAALAGVRTRLHQPSDERGCMTLLHIGALPQPTQSPQVSESWSIRSAKQSRSRFLLHITGSGY